LIACYIGYLTLRENTFAALVVKVQKEREQKVITSGPYRYVRHPMYAGMIFYLLGLPLLLGSWWDFSGDADYSVYSQFAS
jgi:protein-S-isoprenylcysteine O-methyltransferase Ste14